MADIQKSKSRLGRGLSSLISISTPHEAEVAQPAPTPTPIPSDTVSGVTPAMSSIHPAELSLDVIHPNPHQPRRQFHDAQLAELAASMKSNGVIQPIIVRHVADTSTGTSQDAYELIAGERRFRAARLAGFTTIPAIVRDVDSFTQAQLALVENIQREDLNPLDRAQGYRTLLDQLGLTQAELATRLGEDRSSIANFLRLLDLSVPVQEHVRAGRLSTGHAKLLASVQDATEQERLANLCVAQDLSVRNLERLLAGQPAPAAPAKVSGTAAHILDLEKNIARQLGMRVQIKSMKKGRGRLVIHYGSLDQFDELLGRMGVQSE
jgi:ParB family chromosome partitioning protein